MMLGKNLAVRSLLGLLAVSFPLTGYSAQPPRKAVPAKQSQATKKLQQTTNTTKQTATVRPTMARRNTGREYLYGVKTHWIDGEKFWYRHDLPNGRREFIIVDPSVPSRSSAINRAQLATALSKTLGRTVTEDDLPIDTIDFDPTTKALRIQVGEKTYAVDAKDGNLSESEALLGRAQAFPRGSGPRRSRDGGEDTYLTFVNRTDKEVLLFWLDSEGQSHQYGSLRPDEQRKQHTFSGHVWQAQSADGQPVVTFVGGETPTLAVIEATAAPAPTRSRRAPESDPTISPDGKKQVFIRDFNVFLRDVASKQEAPLTTDGTKEDAYDLPAYWSPDSAHVVLFQTIPSQDHKVYLVESSPGDQVQPKIHINDYLKPGDRIAHPRPRLFDVASSKTVAVADDLFPNPWDLDNVSWMPDSTQFTFLYNQRGHQVLRLLGVNATTGAVKPLIEETSPTFIDYSSKTFLHRLPGSKEAIWMSERDGWNHLYRYDLTTGTVKNPITKGDWLVRGVDRVDDDKQQIWFRATGIVPGQDPYYVHFCRVNFDGSGLTVLTEGDGTHTVEYSPNGKYLVDTYSRVDAPPSSTLRRVDDGKLALSLETGTPEPDAHLPERFVAKGRDGKTDIYGVIVRPTNFDAKKKYPVVENIYAGPQGAFVPKAWNGVGGMQALADLGFVVVQMDGMGTNWRSKAFHDVCFKNLADAGFPDRIAWIKSAAKTRPYLDLNRVGLYGTSAGGQNALGGLLLHGDFYKAGMSDCGCHDNRMDKIWWNEQWMGWPVGPEYASNSNVTLAPRLTGKLLLMVGEMDTNVDPASTMQVVNALIKSDKDFDLLVAPGVGHGVAGTPYGRRRLQEFFIRTLRDAK